MAPISYNESSSITTAEVQCQPAEIPGLPDYLLDPNAVLKDTANWRYGQAPNYPNTRKDFYHSTHFPFIHLKLSPR